MSVWCRLGLHRWRYYAGAGAVVWQRCTRVGCSVNRRV